MSVTCKRCEWNGHPTNLEVETETDHEVWDVFCCPSCKWEFGREPARKTEMWLA